eukprot:4292822-Alexandrium_andersonii.AAC.1
MGDASHGAVAAMFCSLSVPGIYRIDAHKRFSFCFRASPAKCLLAAAFQGSSLNNSLFQTSVCFTAAHFN